MSVSKNLAKMEFLKMKTSTSTRMGHVGEQKPCENGVFENKTSTSTRMGHVGKQKPLENRVFKHQNVDVNEDGACRWEKKLAKT